jgi:hypothetical protein
MEGEVVRVHEIAKVLRCPSLVVIQKLRRFGVGVKTASSKVEPTLSEAFIASQMLHNPEIQENLSRKEN